MEFILFVYFCIVFLGLQGLFLFEKDVSLALVMIGNFLILYHSATHFMWDLFLLTILMTIAQLTRLWRGV